MPFAFHDVSYSDKPGEVDFFRHISVLPRQALMELWYTDYDGETSECAAHVKDDADTENWRQNHWNDFRRDIVIKTKDWEHEQESRLILHGLLETSLSDRNRNLTYRFSSLKGIIFGIRTTESEKLKIIDVIHEKCVQNDRSDFKIFQAYYSSDHGDIRKYEIRLNMAGLSNRGGAGII